eukprot:m.45546 g.45546  ORF g.45546 m.45546 type:complete len:356 (+) comp10261_c0_seq2:116-1183(+)
MKGKLVFCIGIALLPWVALVSCGRDLYGILGVDRNANTKDIKRAYRKLAVKYHPDKNPGDEEAANKFQDLGFAYETLSDEKLRRTYDQGGEEAVKKNRGGRDGGDVFSSMFGGMFRFQRGGDQRDDVPKGDDVKIPLIVTLEQLYDGDVVEVVRVKPVPKEGEGTRECKCRKEMKTMQLGPGRFQMVQQKVCEQCPNVVLHLENVELDIDVEAGMKEGQEIIFHGEGEPHIDGEQGNLIFEIEYAKHSRFWRVGDDLHTNLTISVRDALLGFRYTIEHLDGHKVEIMRDTTTAPGVILHVPKEGMKHYEDNNQFGDLYITVDVQFPDTKFSDNDNADLHRVLGPLSKAPVSYRGH